MGMADIAGIDEAGRGPLAGPVVAAAVILDPKRIPDGLDDSKKLTPAQREHLFAVLSECAAIGIGAASVEDIARLNIRGATLLAMQRAVANLAPEPRMALVDGNALPDLPCPARSIVCGDARCSSIAAASIVAKVIRDRIMIRLAARIGGYGWERNMGYGTIEHLNALARLGPTPHHRKDFAPVAAMLKSGESGGAPLH